MKISKIEQPTSFYQAEDDANHFSELMRNI